MWTIDETLFKTIDKKELEVTLKKKTWLGLGRDDLDTKKFKLGDLSSKCECVKEIKLAAGSASLKFQIHQPIKGKDYEEVPSQKLVIDSFIQPFRDGAKVKVV